MDGLGGQIGIPAGFSEINVDNSGVVDVTSAIQVELDKGGNRYIPAGTYLIDALTSLVVRSNTRLMLHKDAVLQAKTNGSTSYSVVLVDRVDNVEISGGTVIGERKTHTGTGGEGGMGVRVIGSTNVTVRDMTMKDCWGDGLYIGPNRDHAMVYSDTVTVNNVICDNNRRNALSITNANNVTVENSQFLNTNGTSPQCGLDIEPNADPVNDGTCKNVTIKNCLFSGNAVYGVNIQRRSYNITFDGCTFTNNHSCGMVAIEAFGLDMLNNTIADNGNTGLFLKVDVTDANVTGNTFARNNGATDRATPITQSGVVSGTVKDLIFSGTGTVGTNTYA